jgi:Flp pilus assembly pilin Flp
MLQSTKRLLKNREAPTAVEYLLMVAGIAVVIISAVWFLGTSPTHNLGDVAHPAESQK